jgi:16S rRNA (cytosine967-C5)-methyltransferase
MPISRARAAAFEILLKVAREAAYASELLHSTRLAKLSSADHGLATELVMGCLRWQSWLDRRIANASSQKLGRLDAEILVALRLGLYQLQFLSRIPARAAIFESVQLVKAARKTSAAPFVNAVLRKLVSNSASAAHPAPDSPAEALLAQIRDSRDAAALAENSAHPEWLVQRWVDRYGLDAARQICAHNQCTPHTSVHLYDDRVLADLAESHIQLAPGLLLSSARIVLSGDVTQTRAYRERLISIQDEASQLVALLVGDGQNFLDCCAAPGLKTALLANRNPHATVFACELHPHRARLLRALSLQPNIRVVAADARQLPFSTSFDRILADVPCSGTGTLARNPEIKWRLTPQDLHDLHVRQFAILQSALAHLSPGGRLVYSTCSLEPEENEAVVKAALEGAGQFEVLNCRGELDRLRQLGELASRSPHSLLDGPFLRTIPGVHPCDGFFAAIIQRNS